MSNSIADEFDRNHGDSEWGRMLSNDAQAIERQIKDTGAGIVEAIMSLRNHINFFTGEYLRRIRTSPEALRLRLELFDKLEDLLDDEMRKKAALQLMRDAGFEL